MTPFETALSNFDTSVDKAFFASAVFFSLTSRSKFLASVFRSDFVEIFLKCLFFAFLSSLYAVRSLGNFKPSDLLLFDCS